MFARCRSSRKCSSFLFIHSFMAGNYHVMSVHNSVVNVVLDKCKPVPGMPIGLYSFIVGKHWTNTMHGWTMVTQTTKTFTSKQQQHSDA